jgi:hypothetical protein
MGPVLTNWFPPTAPVPATPTATPVPAAAVYKPAVSTGLCAATQSAADGFSLAASPGLPAAPANRISTSVWLPATPANRISTSVWLSAAPANRISTSVWLPAPANRISTSVWLLAGTADWFCRLIVSAAEPSAAASCSPTTEPFATAQPVFQLSKCPSHTISVRQYPWSCIAADRFCATSCGAISTPSDRLH